MSLHLDERQRAMLKEMGVTVWWPKPVVLRPEPVLVVPKTVAVPVTIGNEKIKFSENKVLKTNHLDVKNISDYAVLTRIIVRNRSIDHVENSYSDESPPVDQLTWPLLAQAAAGCQACKLCEGRTQTVFGSRPGVSQGLPSGSQGEVPGVSHGEQGGEKGGPEQVAATAEAPPPADWLIVGDVPGDAEDQAGSPFAGEGGQLLGNMLKAMGLAGPQASRGGGVYLTTVIKCRPPGNRNPLPDEGNQCSAYLHRQIELLQPKVILTMGKLAAQALLRGTVREVEKLPPGKLRGQVHAYQPQGANIPLVATYPPAYLLRNPQEKARVWEDLVLAMETLKASAG